MRSGISAGWISIGSKLSICFAAAALSLTLGCGATPTTLQSPKEEGGVVEPEAVEDCFLQEEELSAETIRKESLVFASDGQQRALAFDTLEGEVFVAEDQEMPSVASKGEVGCLAFAPDGALFLGVLTRSEELPVTELHLLKKEADGAWQALPEIKEPSLWVEPGSACAFVSTAEDEVPFKVLTKAREARDDAPLDLWLSTPGGGGQSLGYGSHVPHILDARTTGEGAALVLRTIVRNEEQKRRAHYTVELIGADGAVARVSADLAPPGEPVSLSAESRTLLALRVETGRPSSGDFLGKVHATLQAQLLPRNQPSTPALAQRIDIGFPVARSIPPRGVFLDGRWWAALSPEPYTLRGQVEPAPYREVLVPIEEGRAAAYWLPEEVYNLRAFGEGALVGFGLEAEGLEGYAKGLTLVTELQCIELVTLD